MHGSWPSDLHDAITRAMVSKMRNSCNLKLLFNEINADSFRFNGGKNTSFFKKMFDFFRYPNFKCLILYRICKYLKNCKLLKYTVFPFAYVYHITCSNKYGIIIPLNATIGPGIRIEHFGGIIFNNQIIIGKNCNIHNDVVFGYIPRGNKKGSPISIGNNTYIGPGAKLLGSIVVGDNVVIGANTVVTKDIPDNCTVFGIPGRIISKSGSDEYITVRT